MLAEPLPPWWPHRTHSRRIAVPGQALRWHLQHWAGPAPGPAPAASAGSLAARPVALLLHGTGASSHSWRRLAPLLARHMEVLVPDLPGHAFTHTPATQDLSLDGVCGALQGLLHHLACQPTLLVGHSAGAALACRWAIDAGSAASAARIVAVNGALLPLEGTLGRLFTPLARLLTLNPLSAPVFSAWASWPRGTQRLLQSTGSHIEPLGVRCYQHLVQDARHTGGTLRLMAAWDLQGLQRQLPQLALPLDLIVGKRDRTLPPAEAERVRERLPQARIHRLASCGHLAHEEQPDAVLALCLERRRPPGAAPAECGTERTSAPLAADGPAL
ncbi:MAG: alpha/beta fold hydrolase [Rubrivivax sp.]|nr:alpha/beta fold hydrolase [Rubrivivax sp.]